MRVWGWVGLLGGICWGRSLGGEMLVACCSFDMGSRMVVGVDYFFSFIRVKYPITFDFISFLTQPFSKVILSHRLT